LLKKIKKGIRMELTSFEQKALDGKYGPGLALAARIIVNLGEFFEAPRTVKINSAQISGVSVKTGGRALESVLEILVKGAKTKVPAFLNPAGFDLERYDYIGIDENFYRRQKDIIDKFVDLGVIPTLSCTPYLNGLTAKKGDMLAWAESSAVSFANSYIGARTNRESGLSALSAAMLGTTPYYGLLKKENRIPTLTVELEDGFEISGDLHYIMGLIIGGENPSAIPYIRGIRPENADRYKGLGAAMAASGNISLYHVEGETPEWEWAKRAITVKNEIELPVLEITAEQMERTLKRVRPKALPTVMAVGCPHASIDEIIRIDHLMSAPAKDVQFWIFTSRQTKGLAARMGLVDSLTKKNVEIFADTCIVVSPLNNMNIEFIATNSAKAMHYLPKLGNIDAVFMPLEEMIRVAMEGSL
jgi:hypothetical protein